jgi:hypothetical protein
MHAVTVCTVGTRDSGVGSLPSRHHSSLGGPRSPSFNSVLGCTFKFLIGAPSWLPPPRPFCVSDDDEYDDADDDDEGE